MGFLSKLLNGALGAPAYASFEPIPLDEQWFPDDGLILAPEFLVENIVPSEGLYLGPIFTSLVSKGAKVLGGQPVAEIETARTVFEITSPCSAVVEEVLVSNGAVVDDLQPLIKLVTP